jgi:hypothetical protein
MPKDETKPKAITVTPALSPGEVAAKKSKLEKAGAVATMLRIVDQKTLDTANELVRAIIGEKKAIEAMRKSATQPLNAALREINGWFKPLTALCDVVERDLKAGIAAYVTAEQERQRQAYEVAARAHVAGDDEQARGALAVANEAATSAPQGTSIREVWTAEIIAPNMIPHEYLKPDEAKINAHAKATPTDVEPAPIPGVRFTKKAIVSVRQQ